MIRMKESDKIPIGYKKYRELRNMSAVERAVKDENNRGYNVKFKSIIRTPHYVGNKKRDIKVYELYKRKKNVRKK